MRTTWHPLNMKRNLLIMCHGYFNQYRYCSASHPFWYFYQDIKKHKASVIAYFCNGSYHPQPMVAYHYFGAREPVWHFIDKILQRILYQILKPTFKHVISTTCRHLRGPNAIRDITNEVYTPLNSKRYRYLIRTDIKSYYASINHSILKRSIAKCYDDQRVIDALHRIIEVPIDHGGDLSSPTQGIPRKSSLSPFFAALYLKPLDALFENRQDLLYRRYNDDILILCQTKSQYQKAKRQLKNTLTQLKLTIAPTKTRMGLIEDGFHFLGIQFSAAQTQKQDPKKSTVRVSIHPRTVQRAIVKAKLKQEESIDIHADSGAGTPANVQGYLIQWARWWARIHTDMDSPDKLIQQLKQVWEQVRL